MTFNYYTDFMPMQGLIVNVDIQIKRDLNRMTSGFLLLFFGSDLSSGVGDLHADLLGTLDNFCSFLN